MSGASIILLIPTNASSICISSACKSFKQYLDMHTDTLTSENISFDVILPHLQSSDISLLHTPVDPELDWRSVLRGKSTRH